MINNSELTVQVIRNNRNQFTTVPLSMYFSIAPGFVMLNLNVTDPEPAPELGLQITVHRISNGTSFTVDTPRFIGPNAASLELPGGSYQFTLEETQDNFNLLATGAIVNSQGAQPSSNNGVLTLFVTGIVHRGSTLTLFFEGKRPIDIRIHTPNQI